MQDPQVLEDGGYKSMGLTKLKLRCSLSSFPHQILDLGDTLQELDLSETGLSSLPTGLSSALPHLRVALFSGCNFTIFPKDLASCPNLEEVAFPGNQMLEVPEQSLPPSLRCLNLTNNLIDHLPADIGRCSELRQCLLSGNVLRDLPDDLARCAKLQVLRLSLNDLRRLPDRLFALPELAFLSFARNPCAFPVTNGVKAPLSVAQIDWADVEVGDILNRTDSSTTSQGLWKQSPHYAEEVVVKILHGALTESGAPADEMTARLVAGPHESLSTVLGQIPDHPDDNKGFAFPGGFQGGLVMHSVPSCYAPLARPPTITGSGPVDSVTEGMDLTAACAVSMLTGLAGAAAHIHGRGIAHGDLSAQSILASRRDEHALLEGFGAATVYGRGHTQGPSIERVEVLAFAHLVEYMLGLLVGESDDGADELRGELEKLHAKCSSAEVQARPTFEEIAETLEDMMGWRGMMRIPLVVPR